MLPPPSPLPFSRPGLVPAKAQVTHAELRGSTRCRCSALPKMPCPSNEARLTSRTPRHLKRIYDGWCTVYFSEKCAGYQYCTFWTTSPPVSIDENSDDDDNEENDDAENAHADKRSFRRLVRVVDLPDVDAEVRRRGGGVTSGAPFLPIARFAVRPVATLASDDVVAATISSRHSHARPIVAYFSTGVVFVHVRPTNNVKRLDVDAFVRRAFFVDLFRILARVVTHAIRRFGARAQFADDSQLVRARFTVFTLAVMVVPILTARTGGARRRERV